MSDSDRPLRFQAKLLRPANPGDDPSWTFVVLPREVSEKLPRRGRTTVTGGVNGCPIQVTLEPDGQRSHWLKLGEPLRMPAVPAARQTWQATTTIARVDWIHWMTSAKSSKTRVKRINDAREMLAAGKKRVCCFDQSGYYSKAFSAPEPAQ